jgi:hypothetical protein
VAITFVGSSDSFMDSASATVPLPSPKTTEGGGTAATLAVNDLQWLILQVNANVAMATPTGWTLAENGATTATSYGIFYKWVTGSETWPTNLTMTSGRYNAQLLVFRGVDTTTPLDVADAKATATTTIVAFPSITPVTAGAWVVATRLLLHASGVATGTRSSSNLTQREDTTSTAGATVNQATFTGTFAWTSGAFTPVVTTTAASQTQNRAYVAALRPAADTAPALPIIVQPPRR